MASDIIYEREIEPAEWFLVARAKALRKPNALEMICKHESLDFILRNRVQKRRLGLEVTDARQQMSRSDIELREEILRMEPPWADFYFDEVCRLVSQKEAKRALPQWKYPNATVLLIRLHYSIVEMARFLDGLSTDGGRQQSLTRRGK